MAKFKVGDKVKVKYPGFGYQKGIITGIVDEPGVKKAYEIDLANGERYTVAEEAVFAANSRAINSTNSVVAKAMNSKVAMNADAKKMVADAYGRFIQAVWVDCKEQHSERMAAYQKLESLCDKALVGYWKETGRL